MTSFRIERLNKEFLREISVLLQGRVKNEKAKMAILTAVSCSKDLSVAKVYFTVLDRSTVGDVKAGLEEVGGLLRGLLGKEMRLRKIPEFRFVYDDTEDRAGRVEALLNRLSLVEPSRNADEEDEMSYEWEDEEGLE
ncbi:ribosome-binding factor A [Thermanaerovibrio velox DSM 12556]|uniref:Ribosome-binding factor A n=1 Tax=Thermanaerovibrio velox DSM 12556 TaxID=926567 RepID=H0URL8_9BACT|nr:30S ribosome-binding factor RbfA [Thermanaerovibrio velox]EHM09957.1 ribosome-binding factor A [Thermanaerovibrio velox DSM 12556]